MWLKNSKCESLFACNGLKMSLGSERRTVEFNGGRGEVEKLMELR
jgi:hypothetical protein